MQTIFEQLRKNVDYNTLYQGFTKKIETQVASGMVGSLKSIYARTLQQDLKRPLVMITYSSTQAQRLYDDLLDIVGTQAIKNNIDTGVYLYPSSDFVMMDYLHKSVDETSQRIETIRAILNQQAQIIIAPIFAATKRISPREFLASYFRTIELNDELDVNHLSHWLIEAGFTRQAKTEEPGQFSVRGGVIDIFPITEDVPYRLELFDTEIESIRKFDPLTQKSAEAVNYITVTPCTELPLTTIQLAALADKLLVKFEQYISDKQIKNAKKTYEQLLIDIETLKSGSQPDNINKYISLAYEETATLLDYLADDAILIIDEPSRILEKNKEAEREFAEWVTSLMEAGSMLPDIIPLFNGNQIFQTNHQKLLLPMLLRRFPFVQPGNIVSLTSKSAQEFHGQMSLLKQEMNRWKDSGYEVLIIAANKERVNRVQRILEDYKIEGATIKEGKLFAGFELPTNKLVLLTETELFGQKQRQIKRISKQANAERIKNYQDLKPGDYVVHINHGIGRYIGIETLKVNEIYRDYLKIQYTKNDSLYVPIDQMQYIQKYVGSDDNPPKITSLNGSAWEKTKNKVKKAVQDIADELIKLYAQRKMSPGYTFSKDSEWQKEFEALFMYEETRDQIRSINEIKKDMEQNYPMDRLLCGDVGYGKTEVAIRAAFKAALDGKQVGVLVPTTILAQQHFENFKERFAGYPIRIAVLSRFRSKKEITESIKALKNGELDVVIGTHRLLSKDIQFHDLGLLIIDEEQRFGVTHKERIKQLKQNVDVLTLTATPIPRTLHMSLLGVRDLSLIETPPPNRFPVETFVMEYNPIFIREVIEREVNRGGQVYFVYNKIDGIERISEQLKWLIPDIRIAVGHGKMGEQQLEKVMLEFMDRQYDVLISTTIIETGLDIPNVNTLIVIDADRMGLSQLYQLRGRVGRSNRVAYAYFTYQKDKVLTEIAEKRLQTIREFTELGSGFKIAMRDLSIRGAGNLLGAEQHGHIAAVGFEMYNHLLAEAVEQLKNNEAGINEEKIEPLIELDINAYLPDTYVEDSIQKVELYKKMARAKELETAYEIEEELIDRFGKLPEEAALLMAVTRIKAYCYKYKVTHIEQQKNEIYIKIHPSENTRIIGEELFERATRFGDKIHLQAGQFITITVNIKKLGQLEIVELLEKWMYSYNGVQKEGTK